jgi:4-hydroxybenzoate polyprenyltransferase
MIRLLDFIFVLRPTQFFPLWITMLCGYALTTGTPFFSFEPLPILAILLMSINFGSIFIFNQIADRETDFQNNKLFLISHDHIPLWQAWVEGIALTLISIVGGYWISVPFMLSALSLTTIGVLYSFAGLMSRPMTALAINFLGGVVVFLSGAYAVQTDSYLVYQLLFFSLPYGCAWGAVSLLVSLPDLEGDRTFGKRTWAVHYGIQSTLTAAVVMDGLALILAVSTMEKAIISSVGVSALFSLPLFWKTRKEMNPNEIFLPVKFSMVFLAVGVLIFLPLTFVLLALNFAACKFYYHRRFGLDYPTFKKK